MTAVLILLILFSVFLGLFLGVDQRLSAQNPKEDSGDEKTVTPAPTTISTTTVVTTAQPTRPTSAPQEVGCQAYPVEIANKELLFQKPCLDRHCIILSASIITSLDTTQDPCENFYEFASQSTISRIALTLSDD